MDSDAPDHPDLPDTAAPDLDVARDLCTFIDASPTPFHVVQTVTGVLTDAGFTAHHEADAWPGPGRWFIERGGAVVAWVDSGLDPTAPFTIVGAHTDSPNLRLKPKPDMGKANMRQLGVEVYGGVLRNSWLDRDLGLAGRVTVRDGDDLAEQLVFIDEPIARLPQLAIHLDRGVNDGLKLNAQTNMAPVWGVGGSDDGDFVEYLAEQLGAGVTTDQIVSWDLMFHDTAPSRLTGRESEFVSAPRLDNQLSCFVASHALAQTADADRSSISIVALFDHEEVGSTSSSGAASPLLGSIIERSVAGRGGSPDDVHRAMAASILISSDNAHATHPNYVDRHEPDHHIALNAGPVIKINANERYATDAPTAALFQRACEAESVPFQKFVNRTDLGCGSTIGPITAAELGIPAVDVGAPQLAMHSAREFCGSHDPGYLKAAVTNVLLR